MAASADGERYARALLNANRAHESDLAEAAKRLDAIVSDFRAEINGKLSAYAVDGASPYSADRLAQIGVEIDQSAAELARRASGAVGDKMATAFEAGQGVTARAMSAAGMTLQTMPVVTPEILATLTAFNSDVFSEASTALGDRIYGAVRSGVLGARPSSQVMSDVAGMLRTSLEAADGKRQRTEFSYQGEMIARTEIGKAYSTAQQLASEQIAKTMPSLRKRWIAGGNRRGHMEAEERYAPGGETGPILVSERFEVTDYSRTGTTSFWTGRRKNGAQFVFLDGTGQRAGREIIDRMMHPRDPQASAGNIINCRCWVMEVIPDLAQEADKVIDAEA